jgi:drug/metabolite transporter (DMT)-like permease
MSRKAGAHLALAGANILYGITYSVAKQVMPDHLNPFAFVFTRILGASVLFWLFSMVRPGEKIRREDILRLGFASVFGVALNQSIFLNGLNLTTPIDAAIIMTTTPILVLIFARLLLREPITMFKIIGIGLGATGAILLILYSGEISFGNEHLVGNLMIIVNATSYGLYLVIVKPLLKKYHPITVMKWIFLSGLLLVSPAGIPKVLHTDWMNLPGEIILSIIYVVIGVTFLAYLLNLYSLRHVKPITVSIYIYSQPVIASVVAIIFLQDVVTIVKVISALLVFAGVYFVSYSSNRTMKQ